MLGAGDRAVAGDRARDAHLSRARRRSRRCCSGSTTATRASGCAPMRLALGGGDGARLPAVRLQRQSARGVRRLVAGVAVRRAARRGLAVRAGAGCRRRTGSGGWRWRRARAAIIAAFHALMWPHCLQRLEGVSPEVRAAVAQPCARSAADLSPRLAHRDADRRAAGDRADRLGAAGLAQPRRPRAAAADRSRRRRRRWPRRCCCCGRPAPGPRRRCSASVGAAALAGSSLPRCWTPAAIAGRACSGRRAGRSCSALGAVVPFVLQSHPRASGDRARPRDRHAPTACAHRCGALRPIALQPKGLVFTFVDFGPRLITVTHHDAVTGPYHRNGEQIADVMNASGAAAPIRRTRSLAKYRSDYVLSCPNSSTTTIFLAEAPKGFYAQLQQRRGARPGSQPVALPEGLAVPDVAGRSARPSSAGETLLEPVDRRIARPART